MSFVQILYGLYINQLCVMLSSLYQKLNWGFFATLYMTIEKRALYLSFEQFRESF
jgi:hypothetical protein